MEFEVFTLQNGIRVIHKETTTSDVSHLGVFINAGARDEEPHEHGVAHFLEHAMFKGTKKRKSFHILSRLDSVGGELNAYTTKEDTCFYTSFLSQHYSRSAELLSDIVFNSVFPEKEIKKEQDVIVDEINSYLDSPSEQIFDDYEQLIFRENPLGNSILGTVKSVKSTTPEKLRNFFSKHYVPANMVISSVGNIKIARLKKILSAQFEKIEGKPYESNRKLVEPNTGIVKEIKKKIHQAHCIIGNTAYHANDEKRSGLILLNNLLGGPAMNSRLNLSIREKYGFTYHIESNYTSYSDTGIFSIYLGTDDKWLDKSISLVIKELKKLREVILSERQLNAAKQQIMGQMALGLESKSSQMLGLGKSLLTYDKVDTVEEICAKINKVTREETADIANEIFHENSFTTLKYISK